MNSSMIGPKSPMLNAPISELDMLVNSSSIKLGRSAISSRMFTEKMPNAQAMMLTTLHFQSIILTFSTCFQSIIFSKAITPMVMMPLMRMPHASTSPLIRSLRSAFGSLPDFICLMSSGFLINSKTAMLTPAADCMNKNAITAKIG